MGNKRNRRLRRAESQSSDVEENISETSIVQGNATLTNVPGNIDNVFDRNLGSELTEPSQVSNEIEVISQKLSEQNTKMSQIKEHLNSKFEEILKEIRANKAQDGEKMVRTANLVLQVYGTNISRKNTHQAPKTIKTEFRIITSHLQIWTN